MKCTAVSRAALVGTFWLLALPLVGAAPADAGSDGEASRASQAVEAGPDSASPNGTATPQTAAASSAAPPPSTAPPLAAPPTTASSQPPVPTAVASRARHDRAFVRMHSNYPQTWLELRDDLGAEDWKRACLSPCKQELLVAGHHARVVAPGMSPSNEFRITAGHGTARLKVSGGSANHQSLGRLGLYGGIPLSLLGMGAFGLGKVKDEPALEIGGIVAMAAGGVAILGSLYFLASGGTTVRDHKGSVIAKQKPAPRF